MGSRVIRISVYGLGLLTVVLSIQEHLLAGGASRAPEIDGSSISAGLGLLAAGVLIVRSRWHRK
jgi:hypothetical protein